MAGKEEAPAGEDGDPDLTDGAGRADDCFVRRVVIVPGQRKLVKLGEQGTVSRVVDLGMSGLDGAIGVSVGASEAALGGARRVLGHEAAPADPAAGEARPE